MQYMIETRDDGVIVGHTYAEGTEEEVIAQAKALSTPENVNFVRVFSVTSPHDVNGPEVWCERRDG